MGKELLSVNEFAILSRTTKEALLHYDRIGLLSPQERGKNNYRYYCSRQLAVVNVIRTFQELGMSLKEIKDLMDHRTPENVCDIFTLQIDRIDARITEWVRARKLLLTLESSIRSALNTDEHSITVQFMPAEAIMLGGFNDYSGGQNNYDALLQFYRKMKETYPDLDLTYPVWGLFSERRIKQGDWVWPDRYYFFNPEGYDRKAAALYAIGYARGGYSHYNELFERILEYIDKNDYEICGDAYEEYLLNELSIADDDNYLVRVMITVQKKAR